MKKEVVIAGAGVAGCFLGILLAKKGHKVSIYEKLSETEAISASSSRSYNITFFGYGLSLLKENGLWNEIEPFTTRLTGSKTHFSEDKRPTVVVSKKDSSPYYSISRTDVLTTFISHARTAGCKMHFETAIKSIDKKNRTVTIEDAKIGKERKIHCDMIAGGDGVNSKVRESLLEGKNSKISMDRSKWVYKQFLISQKKAKKLLMKYNFANTWSDKNFVIVAFPNKNTSHTAILITKEGKAINLDLIYKKYPKLKLLDSELNKIKDLRFGSFVTVHTSPWFYKDFVVILGDAAHGFNPFFGQGISAALGDAYVLSGLIDEKNGLSEFQDIRKIHMDALGELSKEGFKRYRRSRKIDFDAVYFKVESILHSLVPKLFAPPVFESITWDLSRTNDYVLRHNKQKAFFATFGITFLIAFLTRIFQFLEEIS